MQTRKGATTILFIVIGLVTVGIAILALNLLTLPLPVAEGQAARPVTPQEIQSALVRTWIIGLVTALGVADALLWWRGLRWGGYGMLVYVVLHFAGLLVLAFLLLFSAVSALPIPLVILLLLLLLIPILLDGLVLRSVARDLAGRWKGIS